MGVCAVYKYFSGFGFILLPSNYPAAHKPVTQTVGKQKMRVLIACEESQAVTIAFRKLGHEAYSCDLYPCSGGHPEWHYQQDVRPLLQEFWDMVIAHPTCRYLTNSGVCHLYIGKRKENGIYQPRWDNMREGAEFFNLFLNLPHIPKVAIENPIMHQYAREIIKVPYTQIIQPWMFGHMEQKATCLWLKGLPELEETDNVFEQMMKLPDNQRQRLHYLPPSPNREKERSKTFPGIAGAMAQQWGTPCFPTPRVPDVWESTPLQAFSHPETLATSQALSTPPTRR